MKNDDKLQELNDSLFNTISEFCKKYDIIVHKIVIEDKQTTFEFWGVNDSQIYTNYYTFLNKSNLKK